MIPFFQIVILLFSSIEFSGGVVAFHLLPPKIQRRTSSSNGAISESSSSSCFPKLLRATKDDTTIIEYDDFLPSPIPNFNATDVVELCMKCLIDGSGGSGLEVCFEFSSDRCRVRCGFQHGTVGRVIGKKSEISYV